MKHILSLALAMVVLPAAVVLATAQATEEAAGQAAEQAGKPRIALTHYIAALQTASEGSDADSACAKRSSLWSSSSSPHQRLQTKSCAMRAAPKPR